MVEEAIAIMLAFFCLDVWFGAIWYVSSWLNIMWSVNLVSHRLPYKTCQTEANKSSELKL